MNVETQPLNRARLFSNNFMAQWVVALVFFVVMLIYSLYLTIMGWIFDIFLFAITFLLLPVVMLSAVEPILVEVEKFVY